MVYNTLENQRNLYGRVDGVLVMIFILLLTILLILGKKEARNANLVVLYAFLSNNSLFLGGD